MKLKPLKLNRPKSAVVLNDSEKKAITGGRAACWLECGNYSFLLPHYGWIQCLTYASTLYACIGAEKVTCYGGCNPW